MQRVVTGGAGVFAKVHVLEVSLVTTHYHEVFEDVFYFLSGEGELDAGGEEFSLRPGAVAVIPRGVPLSLKAHDGPEGEGKLKFIIFGTPPMPIDDERAAPRK